MAMARFSLTLDWPAKSANLCGRSVASNCRSSSLSDAETMPSSRMKLQCTNYSSHQLQGSPEQPVKIVPCAGRSGLGDGRLCRRPRYAEIRQCRNHIFLGGVERALGAGGGRACDTRQQIQLVTQLQNHALRGFLADAWNPHQLL